MERDNIVDEIEERDLERLQQRQHSLERRNKKDMAI